MRARIQGRVQGVGFRWFVQRAADALGLRGWVTNLPDGSVELEAEGSGDSLAELERRVRQGPRFSSVESVEVDMRDARGDYSSFEIVG